jgi:AcrR family transcriptional regulator
MPTQPKSRKEIILDRAEQHFADHGFQGASLSAIARDSEVGNPGLLHHFPSKEVLYRVVLEKQAEELMTRMHRRVETAGSLQKRLQAFVALQVEWMHARPTGFKLVTRELLDNAERIQQAQIRPLEVFLLGSLALLEEAQAAGLVRREIPAVVVLTIILGTLNYAKIVRPTFGKAFSEPALKSDTAWMKAIARDVLRVVSPGDASTG